MNVERDKYLKLEARVYKIFGITTIILLAPNLISLWGFVFYNENEMPTYLLWVNIYQGGLLVAAVSIYQSTALQFIIMLYKQHYSAFKTHYKRLMGLFLTLMITLLIMFWYQSSGYWNMFCNAQFNEMDDGDVPTSSYFESGGLCEMYRKTFWKFDSLEFQYLGSNLMFMVPMFAYFWLNKPHDCYTCLGKDPDRIYSGFQLTFEERAKR